MVLRRREAIGQRSPYSAGYVQRRLVGKPIGSSSKYPLDLAGPGGIGSALICLFVASSTNRTNLSQQSGLIVPEQHMI